MSTELQSDKLTSQVEMLLQSETLKSNAPMNELAKSLNMSARTLRRRLAEQKTTFSEITLNWRIDTATRLLQRDDVRISIIAERLGYSHSSNFERAFKRWTGQTPSAYRNQRCGSTGPK